MKAVLAAGIPNPVTVITDLTGGAARHATEPIVHSLASSVVGWFTDACREVGGGLVEALSGPASPRFDGGWWTSPQGRDLMLSVTGLAALLAVVFVLLAVLQGLIAGDPAGMLRSALGHVPASALGVGVVVAVTEILLRVTDEATGVVMRGTPESLGRFVNGFGFDASVATGGLAAVVLMAVFLIGALLVWAELLVRSALVYLLVAFAPLVLAARIWPAARGMFRRLCELGLALIVSKFAVGLALALGAAALAGGDGSDTAAGSGGGMSLSGLLGGATLMGLAAFTPFVVLRLVPVLETALVAHGVSRSPVRGAQVAAAASAYPARLARLGGGSAIGRPGPSTSGGAIPSSSRAALPPGIATGGAARRHSGAGSRPTSTGPARGPEKGRIHGGQRQRPGEDR